MSDAVNYVNEWHNKGYSGNYIPKALREEDPPVEEWDGEAYHAEMTLALATENGRCPHAPTSDRIGEKRASDPNTGGQKGRKEEEFALVPVWPRSEVARVYGMGARKYDPDNWRKGYPWSWSLSALHRHIAKFEAGESLDPESQYHHLAHAAFHLNTLMEFDRLQLGTDDRVQDDQESWYG